ncbi:MAG: hypothetical protein HUJ53_04565 [Holdemanella sp.]|nr:hypothetical protein [Holdemanella sp.]
MTNRQTAEWIRELCEEVIREHPDEFKPLDESIFTIAYLYHDVYKKKGDNEVLGECSLVSSSYRWTCPYDFTITFYKGIERLTPEQIKILAWHELKHAGTDKEKPYIKGHDLEDFREIIDMYGPYWSL